MREFDIICELWKSYGFKISVQQIYNQKQYLSREIKLKNINNQSVIDISIN